MNYSGIGSNSEPGGPRFKVVEFQLQQACNVQCLYCGYEQEFSRTGDYLPLELMERTLGQDLGPCPPEWVWLEGGEVTMDDSSRAYLLQALELIQRLGIRSRINTNAQKCSPAFSRELARAGLSFACVSCDSTDPDLFSWMRGQKSTNSRELWEEFNHNVQGLLEAGITVDLEVTLNRYNTGELERVYEYVESFNSSNIMMGVQFLVATADHIFPLYPDPLTQHQALKNLLERAEKGTVPLRICCCSLVPCRYPDLYRPRKNVIWVGCTCGYNYVHVHATGHVFLCGFWDHRQPLGNLKEKSLVEIWQESRMRQESQVIRPQQCRDCKFWEGKYRCHNTCFAVVHRRTGSFHREAYGLIEEALNERK